MTNKRNKGIGQGWYISKKCQCYKYKFKVFCLRVTFTMIFLLFSKENEISNVYIDID
jgi:hypothetical protein